MSLTDFIIGELGGDKFVDGDNSLNTIYNDDNVGTIMIAPVNELEVDRNIKSGTATGWRAGGIVI